MKTVQPGCKGNGPKAPGHCASCTEQPPPVVTQSPFTSWSKQVFRLSNASERRVTSPSGPQYYIKSTSPGEYRHLEANYITSDAITNLKLSHCEIIWCCI